MNPLIAVRKKCVDCSETYSDIVECYHTECPLYKLRFGKNLKTLNPKAKNLPVLKQIRLKCLDCCLDQENEVKLCPSESCTLHKFRFGKNPNLIGKRKMPEKLRELNRIRQSNSGSKG